MPVHYAGVGCEMDEIMGTCDPLGISVVEDNAHGLFGTYKKRPLGTFGSVSTLSFHETKNYTCGEGGALVINNPNLIERAEIIREKGTNRSRFFRGQVDKYTWVDIGSSYLPSDLLAAFLLAQLEAREQIQAKRKLVWGYYYHNLQDWAESVNVKLPVVPAYCEQTYHMFYLIFPSPQYRNSMIEHLKSLGISAVFHYLPLHLSEMGKRFGGRKGDCPVAERVSDCMLRLPFYNELLECEQAQVISAIKQFEFRQL